MLVPALLFTLIISHHSAHGKVNGFLSPSPMQHSLNNTVISLGQGNVNTDECKTCTDRFLQWNTKKLSAAFYTDKDAKQAADELCRYWLTNSLSLHRRMNSYRLSVAPSIIFYVSLDPSANHSCSNCPRIHLPNWWLKDQLFTGSCRIPC